LSTSAIVADLAPAWKQEVNRRVAAHQSRKASSTAEATAQLESHTGASSRAAEAAARVAARYAKAPSYSEMLASEARAAVRAAEAASQAALEAQAAAESILAGLEAATVTERPWEPETLQDRASEQTSKPAWEATVAATRPAADNSDQAVEVVEPAQPIPARLIEFPRQLVATRKVRPRLAEGPHARVGNALGQLSIFEVDPASVSTQPAAAAVAEAAPAWPGPDWSSIRLDEQSLSERSLDEQTAEEAASASAAAAFELAPMGRRLMAAVVDGSLIAGAFLALAMAVVGAARELPTLRQAELGAAVTLAVLAALYHAFFLMLAAKTPGMKWARVSLRTFAGQRLTLDQRCGRLGALVLSLLPVGLGVAWAIFDEDHLSWHDRLSGTCVRRG
jgi:uncharacterized RDD family membrane protein YckC